MSTPTSLPVIQPQPNAAFYPLASLQMFAGYTRPSFLSVFGVDAATGNSAMRPKDWFDSSLGNQAPTTLVSYLYVDNTTTPGKPVVATMTMTVAEASQPNIPGVHSYPAYVLQPSAATVGGAGIAQPIPATQLSNVADADALAVSWGLDPNTTVIQNVLGGPFGYYYPPTEPRRVWEINYKGTMLNVGMFLAEMNANGVGAPGKWDLTGPEPNWISSLPSSMTLTLPPWPEPIRALLPNEQLAPSMALFGGAGVMVFRTDMSSPYQAAFLSATAPAVGTSTVGVAGLSAVGGLTAAQASEIDAIKAMLQAILQAAGIAVPAS